MDLCKLISHYRAAQQYDRLIQVTHNRIGSSSSHMSPTTQPAENDIQQIYSLAGQDIYTRIMRYILQPNTETYTCDFHKNV